MCESTHKTHMFIFINIFLTCLWRGSDWRTWGTYLLQSNLNVKIRITFFEYVILVFFSNIIKKRSEFNVIERQTIPFINLYWLYSWLYIYRLSGLLECRFSLCLFVLFVYICDQDFANRDALMKGLELFTLKHRT